MQFMCSLTILRFNCVHFEQQLGDYGCRNGPESERIKLSIKKFENCYHKCLSLLWLNKYMYLYLRKKTIFLFSNAVQYVKLDLPYGW